MCCLKMLKMHSILVLLIYNLMLTKSLPISTTSRIDTTQERQHATCKIITKEIEATANATITKELKGVCTSKLLNSKFDRLEAILLKEIYDIKTRLRGDGFSSLEIKPTDDSNGYSYTEDYGTKGIDMLKYAAFSDEIGNISQNYTDRTKEISQFNNTVQNFDGEIFIYYWNIENIHNLLMRRSIYVKSTDFEILGHQLHIQMYPHHLDTNYIGLQLRSASHSFIKKYKLTILDLENPNNDLESKILTTMVNDKQMYRVIILDIHSGNYIYEDRMVVKVVVYLKS